MNRFRASILIFCVSLFVTFHAYAKLSVRTAEHEGYSRIVFDWDDLPGFTSKKTGDEQIELTFEKSADLNVVSNIAASNLESAEIVSSKPLVMRLNVPKGSQTRSFGLRNRVVVDIYDPPGGKPAQKKSEKKVEKKPEPQKQPPPKPEAKEVENVKIPLKDARNKKEEKPTAHASEHPEHKEAHHAAPPKEEHKETAHADEPDEAALKIVEVDPHHVKVEKEPAKKEENKVVARPNLISISAADNFGMAVFENHSKIFMMVDSEAPVNKPQVSGSNSEYFLPVQDVEIDGAQGFMVPTLPGAKARAEGGKLIWNVIISPDTEEREHAKMSYLNVREDKVRSGSLFWPLENIENIHEFTDPESGERIIFVTVEDTADYIGGPREFVDFDLLPSYAGLAIRPKVDDLEVQKGVEGIEIVRAGGLAITPEAMIEQAKKRKEERLRESGAEDTALNKEKLFDFKRWRMGGAETLNQNKNIILSALGGQSEADQIQNLIVLARMHLASGRAAEAIGMLRLAERNVPNLAQSPQFLALRGAALAFDWKTEIAFEDLSSPLLEQYEEVQFWRAFCLADLGDWQQAWSVMPNDLSAVHHYTDEILERLGLVLAEIKLRAGEIEKAQELFKLIEKEDGKMHPASEAQLKYLKGEAARQKGKPKQTIALWEELTTGPDDLYRAKAGLALARLLIEEEKLTPQSAINNLERLRYAWRGDVLEAHINYWLGRTYFEAGQHIKGLKILRNAIPLAANTPLAQRVAHDMTGLYTEYFAGKTLDDASPLEAVALYEEFTELLPSGPDGNIVIKRLAEHLVRADLLDRASELLRYQIKHRLKGGEAVQTSVRLAAIRLLDKDPQGAMRALTEAEDVMRTLPPEYATPERKQEMSLLRARALSQDSRSDQALALLEDLEQNTDVHRLRADIAWKSGYWEDAAFALADILAAEDISLTRPLTEEQAVLILHRAVALNLSNDRIALANLREEYSEAMSQTKAAKKFEVVTRARQSTGLADRNTMLSAVSEVDLFKDFLNSYKAPQEPIN